MKTENIKIAQDYLSKRNVTKGLKGAQHIGMIVKALEEHALIEDTQKLAVAELLQDFCAGNTSQLRQHLERAKVLEESEGKRGGVDLDAFLD